MKKMCLTLHNVSNINHHKLPIHGAMIQMKLHDGSEKNIVVMGDSGAGKSETMNRSRLMVKLISKISRLSMMIWVAYH